MRLRTTLVLIAVAVAVGLVVYINPFEGEELREAGPPYFYQVPLPDISAVRITAGDSQVAMHATDEQAWVFDEPAGVPPSHSRWGGMLSILGGPRSRRLLAETIADPARYGLDEPGTIIEIALSGDQRIEVHLGKTTPDGISHYARIAGDPQLFLVDASWGNLLARLATDPPYPVWFLERDPEDIVGLTLRRSRGESESPSEVKYRLLEGAWWVQGPVEDSMSDRVDENGWAQVLPLLVRPTDVSVAQHNVGRRASNYGITADSEAIELVYRPTAKGAWTVRSACATG